MSKVGILSSAGITRFHRYYDPLRSPKQPSLALTSYWLVLSFQVPLLGFPVFRVLSYACMSPSIPRQIR